MATVNERFADKVVRRITDISRLESGTARAILKEFSKMEKSILETLATIDPTKSKKASVRKKRLTALLREVKSILAENKATMSAELSGDLEDIARAEVTALNTAVSTSIRTNAFAITYTETQLKRIVDNTLIQGAPSKEWWDRQEETTLNHFKDSMRQGILLGESSQQLARRVKERLNVTRRNAETLARTSVQTVANTVRNDYYKRSDLIRAIEWLATLDSRTSTICMALDGLTWSLPDYKPLGHNVTFPGPTAHWNCRSTQTAVLKSWEEITGRKAEAIPEGTRASMDGQVPESMNYEDWLNTKSEAFQKDVLGPTKHKLWSDGKITLRQLVNEDARPLRIKEL